MSDKVQIRRAFEFYIKHGYEKVADRTIRLSENEYPLVVLRKNYGTNGSATQGAGK